MFEIDSSRASLCRDHCFERTYNICIWNNQAVHAILYMYIRYIAVTAVNIIFKLTSQL